MVNETDEAKTAEQYKVEVADTSDVDSDGGESEPEEEYELNQTTIKDVTPATPSAESTASTLSTNSVGSTILNPEDGFFLVQLTAEFSPNKDHVERAIEAIKIFHAAIQKEDPSAAIMPRLLLIGLKSCPHLSLHMMRTIPIRRLDVPQQILRHTKQVCAGSGSDRQEDFGGTTQEE